MRKLWIFCILAAICLPGRLMLGGEKATPKNMRTATSAEIDAYLEYAKNTANIENATERHDAITQLNLLATYSVATEAQKKAGALVVKALRNLSFEGDLALVVQKIKEEIDKDVLPGTSAAIIQKTITILEHDKVLYDRLAAIYPENRYRIFEKQEDKQIYDAKLAKLKKQLKEKQEKKPTVIRPVVPPAAPVVAKKEVVDVAAKSKLAEEEAGLIAELKRKSVAPGTSGPAKKIYQEQRDLELVKTGEMLEGEAAVQSKLTPAEKEYLKSIKESLQKSKSGPAQKALIQQAQKVIAQAGRRK